MWGRATLALLPTWQEWAIAVFECLRTTLLRYREGAKMFRGDLSHRCRTGCTKDANLHRMTDAGFALRQAAVGLRGLYCASSGLVLKGQATQFTIGEVDLLQRWRHVTGP